MENNFELKVINVILECGEILRERGYLVKLKFWGINAIPLNDIDAITLRNTISNSFYNVFETLLREGGSFNAYELESFAKMFGLTINEIIGFLNNLMEIASRLIYKSDRTIEENIDVKMLYVNMECFRSNMLKFIYDAMVEMSQNMSDEVIEKYSGVFLIETLEFGSR